MEYNYNHFFDEARKLGNKSGIILIGSIAGVSLLTLTLCLLNILPVEALWSLLWLIPLGAALILSEHNYHKKYLLLARKQQISIMAYHAKQVLDDLQQHFPDTFVSDCRIRMCYLEKKGINIEAALARLDYNVEAYNELAMSFLKQSDRLEDELFDLMHTDTLKQYASKAHALRVMANELGISNLTDTAFFHEIEAYAGSIDVIRDNWKKLSFELDEAYDVLSIYIKSIGLVNDAFDKDGNHITFKMWANQLEQAFQALECYDTHKARNILSELCKYQFDADINHELQSLITNIDELMAN